MQAMIVLKLQLANYYSTTITELRLWLMTLTNVSAYWWNYQIEDLNLPKDANLVSTLQKKLQCFTRHSLFKKLYLPQFVMLLLYVLKTWMAAITFRTLRRRKVKCDLFIYLFLPSPVTSLYLKNEKDSFHFTSRCICVITVYFTECCAITSNLPALNDADN